MAWSGPSPNTGWAMRGGRHDLHPKRAELQIAELQARPTQRHALTIGQDDGLFAVGNARLTLGGDARNGVIIELIAVGRVRIGAAMGTGAGNTQPDQHAVHGLVRPRRRGAAAVLHMAPQTRDVVVDRPEPDEIGRRPALGPSSRRR